jgi:hypothetical protein
MHLRFLFFVLLFAQCDSAPAPEKRLQRMAASYCECGAGMAKINQSMQALSENDPAFTQYLDQLQLEYEKAGQCLLPVINELGPLTQGDMAQFQAALQAKCPELAANKELIQELLVR